ncbi:MAG: hypothetical protein L0227_19345 [Chloroflexi bacterium]|nr:hypothetical protein [Chloroflexota bacterium]
MRGIEAFWAVLFWAALVLGVVYVGAFQAHRVPGRLTQVVTWILLTGLTVAYGGLTLYVVVSLLLFTLGTGAAAFGLALSGVLLAATPVAWFFGVRAVMRRIEPRGRARG